VDAGAGLPLERANLRYSSMRRASGYVAVAEGGRLVLGLGDLEVLQWARAQGCPLYRPTGIIISIGAIGSVQNSSKGSTLAAKV